MYQPTTRVLTVLELLQTYGQLSSAELAERLEVTQRSIRRYIMMLQDLGIPVESRPGRYGGYRLRPGYKLPPLMFTNGEALAVTLGLLAIERLGLTIDEPAVEGAMAKIDRVLPDDVRDQVRWVHDALVFDETPPAESARSDTVMAVSQAVRQNRRIWIRYVGPAGETARALDPYGLVFRYGRWYVVGWCHLREDVRVFRLDRIVKLRVLSSEFSKPEEFNAREFVLRTLDERFHEPEVEVLLGTTLDDARGWIPVIMGTLQETPGGVLFTCNTGSLDWMAHYLAGLPWAVTVRKPVELIEAIERLTDRVSSISYEPEPREMEESSERGRRLIRST
jgi:predicted DNA-binding transcriptional regulator YafY